MYFALLALAPIVFGYPMEWFGYVWGIVFVLLFFIGCNNCNLSWQKLDVKKFEKKIFWTGFLIRAVYVILSYWFYVEMNGEPFEFSSADSFCYDNGARFMTENVSELGLSYIINYVFGLDYSDSGYYVYLMVIYFLTGNSILISRIINGAVCAFMCVVIYRLAKRHFSENVSRLAAIFCLFCPYFIFYCGLHLKEVVMTFLLVLFVNSADVLLFENKKWQKWIPLVLCGISLFAFRTVLGTVAFLSFFATLLFSSGKQMSWGKRIMIIVAALGVSFYAASDKIINEVNMVLESAGTDNQQKNMEWRSNRKGGNELAKYAGAAVFAPLIFTIPFPSMVYTEGQENMRLTNGANYVKNIMSFFSILAIIMMIVSGDWRKHVLLLSVTCGYLLVIALSNFAQSGRFHVPVMPFEMMLSAYGVCIITKKQRKFFNMWMVFMFVACIAWQWFKLKGRGMI